MNYWLETRLAEERWDDIRREIARNRQIRQAQSGQSWFGQRMLSLGIWLVSVGARLCQRYDMNENRTDFIGILQG